MIEFLIALLAFLAGMQAQRLWENRRIRSRYPGLYFDENAP